MQVHFWQCCILPSEVSRRFVRDQQHHTMSVSSASQSPFEIVHLDSLSLKTQSPLNYNNTTSLGSKHQDTESPAGTTTFSSFNNDRMPPIMGPIGFVVCNIRRNTVDSSSSATTDKRTDPETMKALENDALSRAFCEKMSHDRNWNLFLESIYVFHDKGPSIERPYLTKNLRNYLCSSLLNTHRTWMKQNIQNSLQDPTALFCIVKRLQMEYTSDQQKISQMIRMGDRFLKQNQFLDSAKIYAECAEMLRDVTGDEDMVKEMEGLNRLVFFGLGHALFALGDYLESAHALVFGFRYFPTFAVLPFVPQSLFDDAQDGESASYNEHLQQLENEWRELESDATEQEQVSTKRSHLQFLLSFQYHFTSRQSEALDLLLGIDGVIPESRHIIEVIRERVLLDSDGSKNGTTSNSSPATQAAPLAQGNLASLPLHELKRWAEKMIDPENGVEIRKRSYRLKSYDSCFVGQELVSWICLNGNISRSEAVDLGQSLMDRYFLRHVVGDHEFKDGFLFYRFHVDILDVCFSPIIYEAEIYSKMSGNKFVKYWGVLFTNGLILFDSKRSGVPKEIVNFGKSQDGVSAEAIDNTVFSIQKDGFVVGLFKATGPDEASGKWIRAFESK